MSLTFCSFCGLVQVEAEPKGSPWSPICDRCRETRRLEAEITRKARAHPFTPNPLCPEYCQVCGASSSERHV